ncbi:endoglucanase 14-like [Haliotis rubra]|uniref:endoglucanase 14-like n=1 Tax=Haliotis rubra TaxID=36100 RepID=UPI001EE51DFF|nr:endoglucanase 14-like [Haliotis rubra]
MSVIFAVFLLPVAAATNFPYTIPDRWNGGVSTNICTTPDVKLCGWEMKLVFSVNVQSIAPHDFLLTNAQSNSRVYYIKNQSSNGDRSAGQELCIGFNADVSGTSPVVISRLVFTKTSSDGQPCPATVSGAYADVLGKSILFYEAQRSGPLPSTNRIPWRADSALNDGSDNNRDLTGGWYDAGDNVKFNFPMAWSTTTLAWGLIQFRAGYQAAGELTNVYDSLRWPLDYLLKCWDSDHNEYWAQVGDGYADHSQWTRPEDMTAARPSYKVTIGSPGSDVTGETAAAFAAASIAFRSEDQGYSARLLQNARSLYDFAYNNSGTYTDSVPAGDFYNSWSGFTDDLCWASAWLYNATGETVYKERAMELISSNDQVEFSWDNKNVGCQLLMYEANHSDAALKALVENFVNRYRSSVTKTPTCELSWYAKWGTLRYTANAALIAMVAADVGIEDTKYREWALSQIDYMLGANEAGRSYVVGYGNYPPQRPHHRASSCSSDLNQPCNWNDYNNPGPNPNVLTGALVGGPDNGGNYADARSDYIRNEVACDYNAGFQSVLAGLVDLQARGKLPAHTNPCFK